METLLEKKPTGQAKERRLEKGTRNKGEAIEYVGGEEIFKELESRGYLTFLAKRGRFIRYSKAALDQAMKRLELAGGIR